MAVIQVSGLELGLVDSWLKLCFIAIYSTNSNSFHDKPFEIKHNNREVLTKSCLQNTNLCGSSHVLCINSSQCSSSEINLFVAPRQHFSRSSGTQEPRRRSLSALTRLYGHCLFMSQETP